jgi:hypothetical protein
MAFASEDDLEQWALGELQGLGSQVRQNPPKFA